MKRKSQSMIAVIALMIIGYNLSAQTEIIYDFNTDLGGVTVLENAESELVQQLAIMAKYFQF
ncbi:hypothetical protein [Flavobacterium flavipallidum]|uniref:Uncharacterized protein n=1 Tax=Flavobacterium flavipallidum TaxID=3139140 RepID=A0ABU9HQ09_9FLAO